LALDSANLRNLVDIGYVIVDVAAGTRPLESLLQNAAGSLGIVRAGRSGNTVELIRPRERADIGYPSLTGRYGRQLIPWHIDTAHWTKPVRFVALACSDPGTCSTVTQLLAWQRVPLSQIERDVAMTSPFLVVTGRRSFYATMLDPDLPFLRHDPGCMRASSDEAKQVQDRLSWYVEKTHIIEIQWHARRMLVFDNWRYLHRRGDVSKSVGRKLLRIYVE
jgi:L-asparagine oxygenase